MIDEKKLIEKLEKQCPNAKMGKLNGIPEIVKGAVDDCIKIVKRQPKVGEWIPCSERLPKQGEQVICTLVSARGHRFVTQEQFFPNLLKEPFPMVAWMPLPEPYREDGGVDAKQM